MDSDLILLIMVHSLYPDIQIFRHSSLIGCWRTECLLWHIRSLFYCDPVVVTVSVTVVVRLGWLVL